MQKDDFNPSTRPRQGCSEEDEEDEEDEEEGEGEGEEEEDEKVPYHIKK